LPLALYLTSRRRRTRRRRIHRTWLLHCQPHAAHQNYIYIASTYLGILASEEPFLLPKPLCLYTSVVSITIPCHSCLSLSYANPSCSGQFSGAGTGVHGDGLADDEAILDELADGLAGVCVCDFALLAGVEPDLALTAADDCVLVLELGHIFFLSVIDLKVRVLKVSVTTIGLCLFVGTDLRRRGASACED
jgi:hypothetical protein